MDEAVEQRIGERWITELGVPGVDGKLTAGRAWSDCRSDPPGLPADPVSASRLADSSGNHPESAGLKRARHQQLGVAAVGPGERQFVE